MPVALHRSNTLSEIRLEGFFFSRTALSIIRLPGKCRSIVLGEWRKCSTMAVLWKILLCLVLCLTLNYLYRPSKLGRHNRECLTRSTRGLGIKEVFWDSLEGHGTTTATGGRRRMNRMMETYWYWHYWPHISSVQKLRLHNHDHFKANTKTLWHYTGVLQNLSHWLCMRDTIAIEAMSMPRRRRR